MTAEVEAMTIIPSGKTSKTVPLIPIIKGTTALKYVTSNLLIAGGHKKSSETNIH